MCVLPEHDWRPFGGIVLGGIVRRPKTVRSAALLDTMAILGSGGTGGGGTRYIPGGVDVGDELAHMSVLSIGLFNVGH